MRPQNYLSTTFFLSWFIQNQKVVTAIIGINDAILSRMSESCVIQEIPIFTASRMHMYLLFHFIFASSYIATSISLIRR